jgi:proline iminopeptidase
MKDPSLWDRDLAAGMESFPGRVLLLSSECSFIGYEYQERLHRARLPASAEHIRLPAAGHNMFTLHPAAAIRAVRAFLAK